MLIPRSSTEEFIDAVCYEGVGSVIPLLDAPTAFENTAAIPGSLVAPVSMAAFQPLVNRQNLDRQANDLQRPMPDWLQGPCNAE